MATTYNNVPVPPGYTKTASGALVATGTTSSPSGTNSALLNNPVPKPPSTPTVSTPTYGVPQASSTPVPKPPTTPTAPTPSYPVPQSSGGSVPVPQPSRWNVDANYQDRLNHFGGNLQDAQSEILAVKQMYMDEQAKGANADQNRLSEMYNWATNVRDKAGIAQDDYMYGNGVPKPKQGTEDIILPPTGPSAPTFTAPNPANAPTVPTYTPNIKTMDEAAIRKYAQDQVNRKLADLRLSADQQIRAGQTTADQQLKGLENSYTKLKTTIGEDRNLQDVQSDRSLSPFSGRSDYAKGMTVLQRERSDREMNQNYQMQQANVSQDLANLRSTIEEKYAAMQNAAPDEQEKLFQSIKNDERQYDLMVHGELRDDIVTNSQLSNTEFQKALQSYNANRSAYEFDQNFGLQEGQLTGNYKGQSTLGAQQLALQNKQANWGAYGDMVNWTGNLGKGPTQTWGDLVNNANSGSSTMQGQQQQNQNTQLLAQLTGRLPNGQPTTAEQQRVLGNLWTVADQTGSIPNELADMYGIPRGTQTQQAKQAMMNYNLQDNKWKSDVDQSLFDYMAKSGQTPKGTSVSDISQNISRSLNSLGDNFDISTPEGKKQIEAMIISQSQDPKVVVPLYNMYGIPVPDELKKMYDQSLKGLQ